MKLISIMKTKFLSALVLCMAMPTLSHAILCPTLILRQTDQQQKPRSLTRQLSAAFGDDHNIVQKTAFIQAVLNETITKPQLIDHLQQRAFVHEAIDKIITSTTKSVPYGADQKQVLTLLKSDLEADGSSWPTASQEWPITQDFVKQIEESATKGPYFALGVFHVYYGGITHGGRDIGDLISKKLNVKMDYYEKSDGYDDYAVGVNKITDLADQQEMIRGGQAAYKYIIAVNDDKAFK